MKEKVKNLKYQLNEEGIRNLPRKEFKVMILKMIQDLRNKMEARIKKIQEMFDKVLKELQNKQ